MTNSQGINVRPFVQANGGVTNYMGIVKGSANAEIGAKFTSGNFRAEVSGKAGTDLGAKVEAGYTLPLSNKVGIDMNAGADYSYRLADKNTMKTTTPDYHWDDDLYIKNDDNGNIQEYYYSIPTDIPGTTHYGKEYTPDMYKAHAGAGVKISPNDKFSMTFGVEGGYRGNTVKNSPSIPIHKSADTNLNVWIGDRLHSDTIKHEVDEVVNFREHKSEAYVTPKIGALYKPNEHLSFGLEGSLINGANATITWTF